MKNAGEKNVWNFAIEIFFHKTSTGVIKSSINFYRSSSEAEQSIIGEVGL